MKQKNKAGFSLVEIMVAFLLLATLAVGGAAVLYQTGSGIQVHGNKRVAMEFARSRIEAIRSLDYLDLRASAVDDPVTVSVMANGVQLAVTTDIILHGEDPSDPDVGPLNNEYLEFNVEVQYGTSAEETVVMTTSKVLF